MDGYENFGFSYSLFNFLNKISLKIIINKQNEVGMGPPHLEPTPLPSLPFLHCNPSSFL